MELQHAAFAIADGGKKRAPAIVAVGSITTAAAIAAVTASDIKRAEALSGGCLNGKIGAVKVDAGNGGGVVARCAGASGATIVSTHIIRAKVLASGGLDSQIGTIEVDTGNGGGVVAGGTVTAIVSPHIKRTKALAGGCLNG